MRNSGIAITICVVWQVCAGGQELATAARSVPVELGASGRSQWSAWGTRSVAGI